MWLSINKVPFAQTRECLVVCCEIKKTESNSFFQEKQKNIQFTKKVRSSFTPGRMKHEKSIG